MMRAAAICAVIAAAGVKATAAEYLFDRLSIDKGLSQSSVLAMLRDARGYMWIGTKYGLNRYDNISMQTYYNLRDTITEIPDNKVVMLYEDARDSIWVGTDKGIAVYNRSVNAFRRVEADGKPMSARCVAALDDGLLFGGEGKLFKYDYAASSISDIIPIAALPADKRIMAIYPIGQGRYMLETRKHGMWIYDESTRECMRDPHVKEDNIYGSYVDSHGNLWLSIYGKGVRCQTMDGDILIELNTANSNLANDIVIDMIEYNGSMWFGTENGISILKDGGHKCEKLEHYDNGDPFTSILSFYEDEFKNLYVGTLRKGIVGIHEVAMGTINSRPDMQYPVSVIVKAPGEKNVVMIGYDGGGVAKYDPDTNKFHHYLSTAGHKVTGLAPFGKGAMLVATYDKGIFRLDIDKDAVSSVPQLDFIAERPMRNGIIIELTGLPSGRALVASDELYVVSPYGELPRKMVIDTDYRRDMTPFYADTEFMLCYGGSTVFRYDVKADTIGAVFKFSSRSGVTCARYDGDHTVWLGTYDGLIKGDLTTGQSTPVESHLYPNVTTLVPDSGRVWLGSGSRLYLHDGPRTMMFNRYDGVAPNEFISRASLVTPDYIFMGGVNGLLKIDRDEIDGISSRSGNVEINLAEVVVDGRSMECGFRELEKVHIAGKSNPTVTIRVISKEPSPMRTKLYRFSVSGLSVDLPSDQFIPELTLSSLPYGGPYLVSVECKLPDGSWSAPSAVAEITVERPWWSSYWALICYVVLGVALLMVAVHYLQFMRRQRFTDNRIKALDTEVNELTAENRELRMRLASCTAVSAGDNDDGPPEEMAVKNRRPAPDDDPEAFLFKIDGILRDMVCDPALSVSMMAERMRMSRSEMCAAFRKFTGKNLGAYIDEFRLMQSRDMLENSNIGLDDLRERFGFRSMKAFEEFFVERTGMTPADYRKYAQSEIDEEGDEDI